MNSSTVPVYERTDPGMGDIASTKPLQHQNTAYLETIFSHPSNDKPRTIFLYFLIYDILLKTIYQYSQDNPRLKIPASFPRVKGKNNIRILMPDLVILTIGQITQPTTAISKNFFPPWFNPKNAYKRLHNAGIVLLSPFGWQVQMDSAKRCKRSFTMSDVLTLANH